MYKINTEHNTGSWFLSRCIKLLKHNKIDKVITYCDPSVGHNGSLYRAANFEYKGLQKYNSQLFLYDGKEHHLRTVYQNTRIGNKLRELRKDGRLKVITKPKKQK